MSARSRRRGDQRGAVAVVVGLLSVVLFGVAAFSVDLGMAYVSKRQLQTVADAAALAAAAEFARVPGDCAAIAADSVARARAESAAENMRAENERSFQGAVTGELGDPLTCPDGQLEVTYEATASTPSYFGGILGGDEITTSRIAAASVSVPDSVVGLRPYVICSDLTPTSGDGVTRVDFPSSEDLDSNCPNPSGNWFTLDCPHSGNVPNGNPDLGENTEFGCDKPVRIVQNQDPSSPANLSASLLAACDPLEDYDEDCLTANPGNDMHSNNLKDAWETLVGEEVILPVFCGKPDCDPVGIEGNADWDSPGPGGNNAKYPVHGFVGVKVCGFHWGPKKSGAYDTHPNVAPVSVDDPCRGATASTNGNENYLVLVFTHVMSSGTTAASSCRLGDACDSGPRRVLLSQ
jgi:Flp pilus assembly protein TadG